MVAEYIVGQQTYWLDVNGGNPFLGLPSFPLSSVIGIQAAPATNSPVPAQSLPAPTSPTTPMRSGVPAGFQATQASAPNGATLYQGPDGQPYTWNGVTMVPYVPVPSYQAQPMPNLLPLPAPTTVASPAPTSAVQTQPVPSAGAIQQAVSPTYSAPAMYAPTQASMIPAPPAGIPEWALMAGAALVAVLLLGKLGARS